MQNVDDLAFFLARILTDASALPSFLASAAGKRFYLREARKNANRNFEEVSKIFAERAKRLVESGISPAGGYMGVWCRDASYILDAWMQLGLIEKSSEWLERIWSHQITPQSKLLFGRGSPKLGFGARVAREENLRTFQGALPTSIFRAYREVYGERPDIDSTALMIKITYKICVQTKSKSLLDRIFPSVTRAVEYLQGRDEDGDGLLEQGANEDWMDSVMRAGKTVYSQAVWLEALNSWSSMLELAGRSGDADRVHEKAIELTKAVDSVLWNGKCYHDKLDGSTENDKIARVNQDVAFYLVARKSEDQRASQALDTLKERLWNKGLGPYVVDPPYQNTGPLRLREMDYQNGAFWPWVSATEVHARLSLGKVEDAKFLMSKILPVGALEWINPMTGRRSGRYPYRSGLAAALTALERLIQTKRAS